MRKAALRVRQHEDGRTIVYGSFSYDTQWQNGQCCEVRGGKLLKPGDDIAAGVEDVAEELAERVARLGANWHRIELVELGQECIADLPAEDI